MNENDTFAAAEEQARDRLTRFWHNADLADPFVDHGADDVGTDAVLALAEGNDYVCDRGLVLRLVEDGVIPVERDDSGSLRWTPLACYCLLMQLEGRRRWKPFSPTHRFKFNSAELHQIEAEAAGQAAFVDDLDKFDVEGLLVMMQDAEHKPVREVLRVGILTKLKLEGAI